MLLRLISLSLCFAHFLGDDLQVKEEMNFLSNGVEYSLDFTWPVDNVLNLPSVGLDREYQNQEPFQRESDNVTSPKWLFRLSCPDSKFDDDRKMYLALRLEALSEFRYFYGGAECGILDRNGRLKNVEKTGKNALLPTLNLRFDPFFDYNFLTKNAQSFVIAPNNTLTVNCKIKGQLKDEINRFNETINGEVVTADYPSRLYVQEETSNLKENGEYAVKLVMAIDNFVEWPLTYHVGNLSFDSSDTAGFRYQIRTYNPANNRYPLFFWLKSLPDRRSAFKGSCTCGLIGKNKNHSQTVVLENDYPHYFFSFPNILDHDTVQSNVITKPYGLPAVEIFCEMKGTLTILSDG